MSALPMSSRTASGGHRGASTTAPPGCVRIAVGLERATQATASAMILGIGPSKRRVPRAHGGATVPHECRLERDRRQVLLRVNAQREQTSNRGHMLIADQHTCPPQQLVTIPEPTQLLGPRPASTDELVDEFWVETAASGSRRRFAVESRLAARGE
jgi:hypothetical protein